MTYLASVETDAGTYIHGFHLGTDERVARQCVVDVFRRIPKQGTRVVTVALLDGARNIVDVYTGDKWSSEMWPNGDQE